MLKTNPPLDAGDLTFTSFQVFFCEGVLSPLRATDTNILFDRFYASKSGHSLFTRVHNLNPHVKLMGT